MVSDIFLPLPTFFPLRVPFLHVLKPRCGLTRSCLISGTVTSRRSMGLTAEILALPARGTCLLGDFLKQVNLRYLCQLF